MDKKTYYECEFCGKSFDTEEECEEHEKTHIEDYSKKSNKEISDKLFHLYSFVGNYRIWNTVLGMPIDSFSSLMREAARRLMDEEF